MTSALSTNTLREWVRPAEAEGTPSKLLMQGEREELLRLRRENRVLKEGVFAQRPKRYSPRLRVS